MKRILALSIIVLSIILSAVYYQMYTINHKDDHGWTLLHRSAVYNSIPLASVALLLRANVNEIDNNGNTPLHYASSDQMVILLLKHRANVNAHVKGGWTPLHCAALAGYASVVDILLHYGANVEVADSIGQTPLHLAASSEDKINSPHIVSKLLKHGAKVNSTTTKGLTPLQYAISHNNKPVIKVLIAHGEI